MKMAGHNQTKKAQTNPRSKSTTNIAAQFSQSEPEQFGSLRTVGKAPNLERIEAEYIKNLQQQIYFLELEANYLREQVRKSTELQPKMTAEAKRMIVKLKDLQKAIEEKRLGVKHKDTEIEVAKMDKERILGKLRADEDSHQREKRLLIDEITQLKNEKALLDRSIANKDTDIADTERRLEISQSSARTMENKLRLIEDQLNQKCDQVRLMQQTVDEKRGELLRAEEKLHKSEELYYSSTALGHDRVKEDLREEVRLLRLKVKAIETTAMHDRSLRNKVTEDSGHAARENARLHQQVMELELELEVIRNASAGNSFELSLGVLELSQNRQHKDWEYDTASELEGAKEELRKEQEKFRHLQKQEQALRRQQLSIVTAESSLAELTAKQDKLHEEGRDLKTERDVLLEHLNGLEGEVEEKQRKILEMEKHVHSLEARLKDLEYLQGLQSSIQSHKWEEFGRLAESMKALSETMAHSHTSGSPKPRSSKLNTLHD